MVAELIEAIDQLYNLRQNDPYQSITLVGHSVGAVFARKISIIAHGERHDHE